MVCLTLGGKMAALCHVKVLLWMREVVGLSHTSLPLLRCIIGGSCHKCHLCRDEHFVFVATKIFCRDKRMLVATKRICLDGIQNVCRDKHNFFATNVLSRQDVFCRNKRAFVATKMILVAAPSNGTSVGGFLIQGQLSVLTLISVSVPPLCYRSST